jgi:hypothetical protein
MTFKKMIQEATFQRLRANWDQQQPLKGTGGEIDFIPMAAHGMRRGRLGIWPMRSGLWDA